MITYLLSENGKGLTLEELRKSLANGDKLTLNDDGTITITKENQQAEDKQIKIWEELVSSQKYKINENETLNMYLKRTFLEAAQDYLNKNGIKETVIREGEYQDEDIHNPIITDFKKATCYFQTKDSNGKITSYIVELDFSEKNSEYLFNYADNGDHDKAIRGIMLVFANKTKDEKNYTVKNTEKIGDIRLNADKIWEWLNSKKLNDSAMRIIQNKDGAIQLIVLDSKRLDEVVLVTLKLNGDGRYDEDSNVDLVVLKNYFSSFLLRTLQNSR